MQEGREGRLEHLPVPVLVRMCSVSRGADAPVAVAIIEHREEIDVRIGAPIAQLAVGTGAVRSS